MITFAVVSVRVPLSLTPIKPGRSRLFAPTRLSAASPPISIATSVLPMNRVEGDRVAPDQSPVAVGLDRRAEVVVEGVALDQGVGGRPADEDAPPKFSSSRLPHTTVCRI